MLIKNPKRISKGNNGKTLNGIKLEIPKVIFEESIEIRNVQWNF